MISNNKNIILAFDTSNEVIAMGLGVLDAQSKAIECIAQKTVEARRASNTRLLGCIDDLLESAGVSKERICCVACGRGPGSFTGVRICIASAKGMAEALEVPLLGVSTLDVIAWGLQLAGVTGEVLVLADAMRREVYPVRYRLSDSGIDRMNSDMVIKAEEQAQRLPEGDSVIIAGDALAKYADLFAHAGRFAEERFWTASGAGLLAAVQAAWQAGELDPFDAQRHDPALLLPVYTRLSDAEENERIRLAKPAPRDLRTGVQSDRALDADDAQSRAARVVYQPLNVSLAEAVARMERQVMGSDAWNANLVADDLQRKDRTWWAAIDSADATLVGYAGGWVIDGWLQVLKVGCDPEWRRMGIARNLLGRIASDARDLGAHHATLEVRAANEGAHAFYRSLGMESEGKRPHYYSDREDALVFSGPLPVVAGDVAGMELRVDQARESGQEADSVALSASVSSAESHPLILAIESSCDETAAAVVDGAGTILADTVASQIDFHSRFGGVVPEIASRKHVEAICGVTQVCLENASNRLGRQCLRWRDLDAVAVTYAPGLVGALVVGVAFGKAAAWAAGIPFIGVNHLEGHLYANKIAKADIQPPMVVSLVSGGNTMLVHVRDWGDYQVLGETIDDAVGEAFDKVAKALGLGYPGGPVISKYAAKGDPKAIDFPRAMMHSGDLRFSLSGLKTAVTTYINDQLAKDNELDLPNICASFQQAVIDVQVSKACTALDQTGAREFCLGGGVAANRELRASYQKACRKRGVNLTMPPLSACTDNAAMIALVALDRYEQGRFFGLDADAAARTNLEEPY